MDNKNGGQSSIRPGVSAWDDAAAKNAKRKKKVATKVLSSAQRQQRTVANIARQKVLDAYKRQSQNYREPARQQTSAMPQVRAEDWRKYHSAWQDYYQKYYGEYYGRAAKEYVARERLKYERDLADRDLKAAESERSVIASTAEKIQQDEEKTTKNAAPL